MAPSCDEAKIFFRPSLNQLHDPFLMKDMDRAVDRVVQAIDNGEKIMIYGDYDVDGTTAVALVYTYLKKFFKKKKIEFYIPDRYDEGYGISFKGIDYAAENDFKLVIALDCGIKAVERIQYANERGVDSATTIVQVTRFLPLWLCSTPSVPTAPIPTRSSRVAAWASSSSPLSRCDSNCLSTRSMSCSTCWLSALPPTSCPSPAKTVCWPTKD